MTVTKPKYSEIIEYNNLTEQQFKNLIYDLEYRFDICYDPGTIAEVWKEARQLVWTLETISFICPSERKKILKYVDDLWKEALSTAKERKIRYEDYVQIAEKED